MQLNKLKIIMIGPCGSAKTTISNYISDAMIIEEATPKPTQGVRIVEFELRDLSVDGINTNIDIELWDCSGDHGFETCWPSIRAGAHGVILVCTPSTCSGRELDLLYNYFVSKPQLSAKQCVLFLNCTDDDDSDTSSLSATFSKVSQVNVNLKTGGNRLKIDFSNFISSVLHCISNK